jgi:hypothetical protein
VLSNFLQALCAILLGNLAYLVLQSHLPLPAHHAFRVDSGLIVDFFFCLILYFLIRKLARTRRS